MLSLQVNMLFFSYVQMHWLLLSGQNAYERKLMMKVLFGSGRQRFQSVVEGKVWQSSPGHCRQEAEEGMEGAV